MGSGSSKRATPSSSPAPSLSAPSGSKQERVAGGSTGRATSADRAREAARTSQKQRRHSSAVWKRASKDDEVFEKYLQTVFKRADQDNSGFLDRDELHLVLHSPKLGLHLTEKEAEDVINEYDTSRDGKIDYEEFSGMLRHLLRLVQSKVEDPVNDWALIEDPEGKTTLYLNKRTGKLQKSKPMTFNAERVEYVTTRHVTVADGTTVTVRTNDATKQEEYIDFDTGEWKPFDPADFEPAAALEYKGLPITFESGDAWRAYGEDLENPPFARYRVPLLALLDVDANLRALCDDLAEEFPDLKAKRFALAVAATVSGYEYDLAKEFIVSNKLSSADLPSPPAATAGSGDGDQLPHERIAALEQAAAEHAAKAHRLEDELTESRARCGQLEEANKLLQKRVDKLAKWQQSRTRATAGEKGLADSVIEADEEEIADLKRCNAALEAEVASLEKEVRALQDLQRKRDEASKAATALARSNSETTKDQAAAAFLAEAAAAAAAAQAEVEALRAENAELKEEKAVLSTQCRASEAKVKRSSMSHEGATSTMRLLKRELRETRAAADAARAAAKDMVGVVKPMMRKALAEARALDGRVANATRDITLKYLKESALRKKYYNEIQELKGNIRVFVRVRKDARAKGSGVFTIASDTECVVCNLDPQLPTLPFEFSKVYGPSTPQEVVFAETQPTLMSVVDGFNVCIIAYGQTGSGKTFTMMGPESNPGVNRRAIRELLERLESSQGDLEYQLEASQIEVYNEGVYDLLNSGKRAETKIKPRTIGKTVDLPGLTWRRVASLADVEGVMSDGEKNRSTAATAMNTESSRSHLVMQLRVTVTNGVTKKQTKSVLTLVDLAGSERLSKSEVSGNGLVEAAAINKSLSSLGQVFLALARGEPHVPYRNSALTTVLQESLGGQAKCCMFANVSPLESNLGETISTLKFANNITKIELGPAPRAGRR